MGNFYEQARLREFETISTVDPVEYRRKVCEGAVSIPTAAHTIFYLSSQTEKRKKHHVDNSMFNLHYETCARNETAMMQLFSMLHRIIKRRDSPFASLKESVLLSIDILGCDSLKSLLKEDMKGTSNRKIDEISTCIYNLALLGIYTEMSEGLNENEEVVFGGAVDLGFKVKKTKEYAGAGVKYRSLTSKSLVARLMSFKKTASKTGLALITVFQEATGQFNDVIRKYKCLFVPCFL